MCLIVLSLNPKSDYKLVLTSNRDEFYERPTESMHWWDSSPRVLAGKDKNFDGTWMALSEKGKFAAVTNVREFTSLSTCLLYTSPSPRDKTPSRMPSSA